MKKIILLPLIICSGFVMRMVAQAVPANVYFTSEITPESLVRIYHALGETSYNLIDIDESTGIGQTMTQTGQRFNVFTPDGIKVLTNAKNLDSLAHGVYIVNGRKTTVN